MTFNKYRGKPFSVSLNKNEQRVLDEHIAKRVLEMDKEYTADVDIMVLYTLMQHLGFKKARLRRFWEAMKEEHDKLIQKYEMPDDYVWLAERKLVEAGVDVRAWSEEMEDHMNKDKEKEVKVIWS